MSRFVNIGEPGMHGSIPRDRFLPYFTYPDIQAIDKKNAAETLIRLTSRHCESKPQSVMFLVQKSKPVTSGSRLRKSR